MRRPFCEFVNVAESPWNSSLKLTWFEVSDGLGIYEYLSSDGQLICFELSIILLPLMNEGLQHRYLTQDCRCEIFDVFKHLIKDYINSNILPAEFKLLMMMGIDDYVKAISSVIAFKKYGGNL